MLQWSSANKNKCSRKIGEKRLDFAPLFRINLCFPSFLLDKVSQPIPDKGHRRRRRTNSGGHWSFLQMKTLNISSIEQLIRIILKEKYLTNLVSRFRRLWRPGIKYAQVRQKMKGGCMWVNEWKWLETILSPRSANYLQMKWSKVREILTKLAWKRDWKLSRRRNSPEPEE